MIGVYGLIINPKVNFNIAYWCEEQQTFNLLRQNQACMSQLQNLHVPPNHEEKILEKPLFGSHSKVELKPHLPTCKDLAHQFPHKLKYHAPLSLRHSGLPEKNRNFNFILSVLPALSWQESTISSITRFPSSILKYPFSPYSTQHF